MEPFRPVIDLAVWQMQRQGLCQVNADTKRVLVQSIYQDVAMKEGKSPVIVAVQSLATSLAQVLLKERKALDLPLSVRPLQAALPAAK
jgi:CRISPR-associated protein Cas1